MYKLFKLGLHLKPLKYMIKVCFSFNKFTEKIYEKTECYKARQLDRHPGKLLK
jgi:hypothetical protein